MGRIGKPQKSRKHKKVRPLDPLSQDESGTAAHSRNYQTNQKPKSMEQEVPRKAALLLASMKGKSPRPFHPKQAGISKKGHKKKFTSAQVKNMKDTFVNVEKLNKEQQSRHSKMLSEEVLSSADLIDRFKLDRGGDLDPTKTKRAQKKKRRAKEHKQKEKERKLEKEREKERDFRKFKDNVMFGEIVHAPPMLSTLPRKANTEEGVARPGKKSLLLKEIISTNSAQGQGLPSAGIAGKRQLGQTIKRKHLSMAKQHIMDTERDRAIELYRHMKNKKIKTFS